MDVLSESTVANYFRHWHPESPGFDKAHKNGKRYVNIVCIGMYFFIFRPWYFCVELFSCLKGKKISLSEPIGCPYDIGKSTSLQRRKKQRSPYFIAFTNFVIFSLIKKTGALKFKLDTYPAQGILNGRITWYGLNEMCCSLFNMLALFSIT